MANTMDERKILGIKALCIQGHEFYDDDPSFYSYGYEEYNGISTDMEVNLECPICKSEDFKDAFFSIYI